MLQGGLGGLEAGQRPFWILAVVFAFVAVGIAGWGEPSAATASNASIPTGDYLGINDYRVYHYDNTSGEVIEVGDALLPIALGGLSPEDGQCTREALRVSEGTTRGCTVDTAPNECLWLVEDWWNSNQDTDFGYGRCLSMNVFDETPGDDAVQLQIRLAIQATNHGVGENGMGQEQPIAGSIWRVDIEADFLVDDINDDDPAPNPEIDVRVDPTQPADKASDRPWFDKDADTEYECRIPADNEIAGEGWGSCVNGPWPLTTQTFELAETGPHDALGLESLRAHLYVYDSDSGDWVEWGASPAEIVCSNCLAVGQ